MKMILILKLTIILKLSSLDLMFPRFDVILMDNNMPNMCGPEATKIARSHGYKGIILGVTGNVNKEQIDDFLEHGVDDVFPKPLNMDQLTKTVRHLLESSSM
jgi:CheY-like chemotaxis protein